MTLLKIIMKKSIQWITLTVALYLPGLTFQNVYSVWNIKQKGFVYKLDFQSNSNSPLTSENVFFINEQMMVRLG